MAKSKYAGLNCRLGITVMTCMSLLPISAAYACDKLADLNWLIGDWQAQSDPHRIEESWRRLSRYTFEGEGATFIKNSETLVTSESLRLVEMSGALFFIAKVSHNPLPVSFKLTSCEKNKATFENTDHDFPNTLRYSFTANKGLVVNVNGKNGEGFELNYVAK